MSDWPRAVLFDWDNTLMDTMPLILRAHNAVRAHFGMDAWNIDDVHERTAAAAGPLMRALYGAHAAEAGQIYIDYFATHHLQGLTPLDGAQELLDFLQVRGVPMGVVSNKRRAFLHEEVAAIGWGHYFGGLVAPEDVGGQGKPDPMGVFVALRALGLPLDDYTKAWYVGDTVGDMQTAQAAGVVGVLFDQKGQACVADYPQNDKVFCFLGARQCIDYLQTLEERV